MAKNLFPSRKNKVLEHKIWDLIQTKNVDLYIYFMGLMYIMVYTTTSGFYRKSAKFGANLQIS